MLMVYRSTLVVDWLANWHSLTNILVLRRMHVWSWVLELWLHRHMLSWNLWLLRLVNLRIGLLNWSFVVRHIYKILTCVLRDEDRLSNIRWLCLIHLLLLNLIVTILRLSLVVRRLHLGLVYIRRLLRQMTDLSILIWSRVILRILRLNRALNICLVLNWVVWVRRRRILVLIGRLIVLNVFISVNIFNRHKSLVNWVQQERWQHRSYKIERFSLEGSSEPTQGIRQVTLNDLFRSNLTSVLWWQRSLIHNRASKNDLCIQIIRVTYQLLHNSDAVLGKASLQQIDSVLILAISKDFEDIIWHNS